MQPRHGSEASGVNPLCGMVNEETGPSASTGRSMNLLAPETAVWEERVWGCVLSGAQASEGCLQEMAEALLCAVPSEPSQDSVGLYVSLCSQKRGTGKNPP